MKKTRILTMMLMVGLVAASSISAQADVNEGILAYYSFDGISLGADSSANNVDAQNSGCSPAQGVIGRAAQFSGKSSLTVDAFRNYRWGNDFSVSFWFKRTGGWGRYMGVINNGQHPDCTWEFRLGREKAGGALYCGVGSYTDPSLSDFRNMLAPPEQWNHVAMSYDGTNLTVFLNGAKQEGRKKDEGPIISTSSPLIMGLGRKGFGEDFDGLLDEVRLYGRTLNEEEMQELYAMGSKGIAVAATGGRAIAPTSIDNEPVMAPRASVPAVPILASSPDIPNVEEPVTPAPAQVITQPLAPKAAPGPLTETGSSPDSFSDPCCDLLNRWISLWHSGRKQDVINELNRHKP
ncbi:MAG: hypothetical protein KJ626_16130 [Verrucomicrobia bacterium]|nr:hypothetical protein [Verrucomicrobiota bacterium]